jgi:hypothetical protein
LRQRESRITSAAREWSSGASQTPYWFRSGEAFCCQPAAFAITDMGRSGVRNSNPIGVRPLLLRAIRPRGSHHVRAGMPEANRRVRPAWLKSSPCLGCNQPPRLSGMNACPQTVPSGDGSRQFTTSFASNVRERPPPLLGGNGLTPQPECRASPPNSGRFQDCRAFWRPTFAPRNYGPAQRQPGPLAASPASAGLIFPISDAANPPSHGPCRLMAHAAEHAIPARAWPRLW